MPQQSINYLAPIGFEGMLADTANRIIRGAIEGWTADVPIQFGVAVTLLNGKISPLTGTGQKVVGIAVATDLWGVPLVANDQAPPPPAYPTKVALNILTVGDIFVWSEDAVNAGDSLLVRFAAATAPKNIIGRFAKAAGTSLEVPTGAEIVALTTTKGAGIVAVRVNTK